MRGHPILPRVFEIFIMNVAKIISKRDKRSNFDPEEFVLKMRRTMGKEIAAAGKPIEVISDPRVEFYNPIANKKVSAAIHDHIYGGPETPSSSSQGASGSGSGYKISKADLKKALSLAKGPKDPKDLNSREDHAGLQIKRVLTALEQPDKSDVLKFVRHLQHAAVMEDLAQTDPKLHETIVFLTKAMQEYRVTEAIKNKLEEIRTFLEHYLVAEWVENEDASTDILPSDVGA